jgi:adenylate kinase
MNEIRTHFVIDIKALMSGNHRFATEEMEKFSTVDLIAELKRRYQVLSRPERSCVLLGPPCSGVASQSQFLRKEWGLCSLKRDDIFSDPNTDMASGLRKLSEEIGSFRCRRGFVLERFPQNETEAKLFDEMMAKQHTDRRDFKTIVLDFPHDSEEQASSSTAQLLERGAGRIKHESSGRLYNSKIGELTPKSPNLDDITGEALVHMESDTYALKTRIENWWSQQLPLLQSYFGPRIHRVDASQSIDTVSIAISRVLLESKSGGAVVEEAR